MYILEIHPREYGLFKSKKKWFKSFPDLRQISAQKYRLKVNEKDLPYYKRLCKKVRVDCLIYEDRFGRSYSYRAKFLREHPPLPNGKYRCWYCGKKTRQITVDHIISIAAVKRDPKLQKQLDRKGIDINGEENLALCCAKCNQTKSQAYDKSYIRRAKRGRHESYWKFRNFLRLLILLGAAALVCFIVYKFAFIQLS